MSFRVSKQNPFDLQGQWDAKELFDLSLLPEDDLAGHLDRLTSLAGLRTVPEKAFFDGGAPSQQNINAGGMVYWEKIRDDSKTRKQVNEWLRLLFDELDAEKARYMIEVFPRLTPKEAADAAEPYFEELSHSGGDHKDVKGEYAKALMKHSSSAKVTRIIQDESKELELTARELGLGVNQVIPLLGAAWGKQMHPDRATGNPLAS